MLLIFNNLYKIGVQILGSGPRILLVMRDKKNQIKNLVHASHLFVSETLLRRSKVHITKSQKVSLDLFSVKLILEKSSPSALEYFVSSYFIPQLIKFDKVSGFIKQYTNIEKMGLFFPILVQELTFLGNTIYLEKPTTAIADDVQKLVDFLEAFSKRQVGDVSVPETFTGKYIRCAIRIIASRQVREARKIEGRRQRIISWIKAGYPNIYIIGASTEDNKVFMDDVIASVQESYPELEVVKTYEFEAEINVGDEKKKIQDVLTHLHYSKGTKYTLSEEELLPTLLTDNLPDEESSS